MTEKALQFFTGMSSRQNDRFPKRALSHAHIIFLPQFTVVANFHPENLKIGFPSPKLDIIGIENFTMLGMENWGFMTFHQAYFLVSKNTPLNRIQRITRLVGHEVSKQERTKNFGLPGVSWVKGKG